jgi:pteridine reductase
MNLNGKTAMVTGGAVRIGAAICRALAGAGMNVIIHYHRSAEAAQQLADELRQTGVQAWTLQADLCCEDECRRLIEEAGSRPGGLHVLVNSAAVFHKQTLRQVTFDNLQQEFWPNLMAPLIMMRAFAEKCKEGKIVNLLDRRIDSLDTECVPYVLSKKALAEATKLAALEFAPKITVNGIAPGAILPPPGKGQDYLRDKAGPVPLQRQCTPEEVAEAVLFLLQSDALTGQIVYVDGGQHLL